MDFYKFININTIEKFENRYIKIGDTIYTNPTPATLRLAGYKPLNDNLNDLPATLNNNEYIDITYTDTDSEIVTNYTIKTYPDNNIQIQDEMPLELNINQEGQDEQ